MKTVRNWLIAALGFAALLAPTAATAEWWEARTEHFIVYSEDSKEETREFAEKLERFDRALRSLQKIEPDPNLSDSRKVTIFRFGDSRDIARMAGNPRSGVAGFYIARASGPVAFTPSDERIGQDTIVEPEDVLFHEYAHHFMFRHFPAAYPGWYIEGLAEVYSTLDLNDDGTFQLGNPPVHRGDELFGGLRISIEDMLLASDKPDYAELYGRYSYGWLLAHYLNFEPSRKGQLMTYLKLINAGTDMGDAAKKAFGNLEKLEDEANRYKRRRVPAILVEPGNYTPPSVTMRRLNEAEEAIMRARMRSARGVNKETAGDVAHDAREVAARYPRSFAVQLELAEAELDARNLDAADRAADAALALRPDSVEALIKKGEILMQRAESNAALYAEARKWFVKAFNADKQHPMPLYYNYLTYTRAKQPVPESAIIALERAYTLAPYDDQVRLTVVTQLLAEKDGKLARRLLTPLALSPHGSDRAKALYSAVELIDAGKVDEALAKIRERLAEEKKEREGDD